MDADELHLIGMVIDSERSSLESDELVVDPRLARVRDDSIPLVAFDEPGRFVNDGDDVLADLLRDRNLATCVEYQYCLEVGDWWLIIAEPLVSEDNLSARMFFARVQLGSIARVEVVLANYRKVDGLWMLEHDTVWMSYNE